jgi:hypothetical protein
MWYCEIREITQEPWIMKTKNLFSVFLLTFLLIVIGCGGGTDTGSGGTITLAWDSSNDPNVAGYKIYYGTATGSYDHSIDVGNVTTHHLTGLTKGQTYYIVTTSYDTSNNESGYSNEVSGMAK